MKTKDFVKEIRKSIIDENETIYRDLFETTDVDQTSDVYWKEALIFFNKLEAEDRETLFKIMRQVSVDTISNIFAVLDGVSFLEGQEDQFNLTIGEGMEQLNGSLQDIFLEIEEDQ